MGIAELLDPTNIDYNAPTQLSDFVSFFRNWPRYGRGNKLDFSTHYVTTIVLIIVPFVVISGLCALFAISVNVFYGGVKRRGLIRSPKTSADSDATTICSTTSTKGYIQVAGGVILFGLGSHLAGLAFVANHYFYAGYQNVVDLSESAGVTVITNNAYVLQIIQMVLKRADENNEGLAGYEVKQFVKSLLRAQLQFEKSIAGVSQLVTELRKFGSIAFWSAAIVGLVLIGGIILLFSTAFPKRQHQRIAMSLFILPLVISWICVAIITASGIVASDLCIELSEFQKIVLVQSESIAPENLNGIQTSSNLLIRSNVQCPTYLVSELAETANSLAGLLRSDPAIGMLKRLYPSAKTSELRNYLDWIVPALKRAVDCTVIARLAGQYMFAFCGVQGPITGLFVAWCSVLALALVLSFSYLLTQFTTFEVSRFLTPYMRHDEDIYSAIFFMESYKVDTDESSVF